jgi:NAD(P)-dependent dehydrogenase (short-subunit alcohol dehydrogenase family)
MLVDAPCRFGRLDIVNNAGVSGGRAPSEHHGQTQNARNQPRQRFHGLPAASAMRRTGPRKPAARHHRQHLLDRHHRRRPCAYTAAKGAVRTEPAAHPAPRSYDIRCNSIPAASTPIFNRLWQAIGAQTGKALIDARHRSAIWAGGDIAEAVLYLTSDRSKFIDWHRLVADGGIVESSGGARTPL